MGGPGVLGAVACSLSSIDGQVTGFRRVHQPCRSAEIVTSLYTASRLLQPTGQPVSRLLVLRTRAPLRVASERREIVTPRFLELRRTSLGTSTTLPALSKEKRYVQRGANLA